MREEIVLNYEKINSDQNKYDEIREAINKLASTSQDQFEEIKKEKWYNRVFDMVTFSQKGKKRLAEQINTVAQAQQILLDLLLMLSSDDANISKIVMDSLEDIQKIQNQNIYLLSRIKQLENNALGISPDTDIKTLSDKEKKVLCACLYKINDRNADASEAQQKYANIVFNYLGTDTQMENPTAALENMDNKAKRKILTCCLEYIFLKDCSQESFSQYSDFIDEFDFGNKTLSEIKKQIQRMYKLRGYEGFYSKYDNRNFLNINDFFIWDFSDAENNAVEANDFPSEMSDETLETILKIDPEENIVFENKRIHLKTYINCMGSLTFENCIIYYNEKDSMGKIILDDNAFLTIKDSSVVCKGYDKSYFISCEGKNTIGIINTIFTDCSYFLNASCVKSFFMNHCELNNCNMEFVSISGAEQCCISENNILQNDISDFNHNGNEQRKNYGYLFSLHSSSDILLNNNTISETDGFREKFCNDDKSKNTICYFWDKNIVASQCSFRGISSCVAGKHFDSCKFENCLKGIEFIHADKLLVEDCSFNHCTNIIVGSGDAVTTIKNCRFMHCYGILIAPGSCSGGINIEFCEFCDTKLVDNSHDNYNLFNTLVMGSLVGGLSSILLDTQDKSSIRFLYSPQNFKTNYIKRCVFDRVELGDAFLISTYILSSKKPKEAALYVEDCIFKNCATQKKSGKIIKEYTQYDTSFKETKNFHINIVSNCRGLDEVKVVPAKNKDNKGQAFIKLKC